MAELQKETIGTGLGGVALAVACAIFAPQYADEAQKEKMVSEAECRVVAPIGTASVQYKYNPLLYMGKGQAISNDTIEVIARIKGKDSTLFIGNFAIDQDTTSLLDINVNLSPSAPAEK